MGILIIIQYKNLALATVIAIFLYGGILALRDNTTYTSNNIKIIQNIIYDNNSKKMFKIGYDDVEKVKKLSNSKTKYVACQSSTLFGRKVAEQFCYLIDKDFIFKIKEIN